MKYSFEDLPKLSITLMLAAVFFVIGLVILTALGNNSNFTSSQTITNESFTMPADDGNISLATTYVTAITLVTNSTGTTYPAANYTLSNTDVGTAGRVQFLENATVCKTGATCLITYTRNSHTTSQGTVITNSITALSEIPNNWFLLIVVVLIAAVIIGIVVSNMGGYNGGRI